MLIIATSTEALPDEQFGFLPGRSTVWPLLQVLEDWESALDSGKHIHACFLDIAKAFDRVDHNLFSVNRSPSASQDLLCNGSRATCSIGPYATEWMVLALRFCL